MFCSVFSASNFYQVDFLQRLNSVRGDHSLNCGWALSILGLNEYYKKKTFWDQETLNVKIKHEVEAGAQLHSEETESANLQSYEESVFTT